MLDIEPNLKRKDNELMGKDVDAILDYLKSLNDKVGVIDNKVDTVSNKQHDQQVSIKALEINVDNISKNVTVISTDIKDKITKIEKRCEEHKDDLKTANNFIITHEAKEKTILGIRTDIIAWFSLLVGLVAIIANIDKIFH